MNRAHALHVAFAVALPFACGNEAGDDAASTDAGGTESAEEGSAGSAASDGSDGSDGSAGSAGSAGSPAIGEDACELGIAITGAVTWSTPSAPACAIPFGPPTGISMGWIFVDGPMQAVGLDVDDVTEGETGTFPATITLTHTDGREWSTATCTVEIDSHAPEPELDDEFSRAYRVHATGSCLQPATDEAGSESVVVASFALRFPARWS